MSASGRLAPPRDDLYRTALIGVFVFVYLGTILYGKILASGCQAEAKSASVIGRSSLVQLQGQVHRMRQSDVDDINRKLAVLAARHGFAAIARNAPLEKSGVVFEAITWRGPEVLTHTATYPDSKFARKGGVATLIVFVEKARIQFGSAGR